MNHLCRKNVKVVEAELPLNNDDSKISDKNPHVSSKACVVDWNTNLRLILHKSNLAKISSSKRRKIAGSYTQNDESFESFV